MSTESDNAKSTINTFDYVIVGAGPSAIGILYGLLEEISNALLAGNHAHTTNDHLPSFSIAVVERGHGPPHDVATHYPHQWFEAANPNGDSSKSVKLYPSEIMGRVLKIPVGQGLGGTSNVNACLCLPPLQQDLKLWPERYRSSLRSNAKYLKSIMEKNKAIQHTSMGNTHNPFSRKNTILEFCTKVPTVVARDETTGKLVRRNYHDALLEPLLKQHPYLKKYLHLFRGYEAQRLLLKDDSDSDSDSTRVIGVECISTRNDSSSIKYREIYATRRVILCAGAIESPALLLVSKLGGKDPLLGVGRHLRDQALIARVYIKAPLLGGETKSPNGISAIGHLSIARDDRHHRDGIFQVAITDSVADAYIIPPIVAMALRWKCQNSILMELIETIFRFLKAIIYCAILYTPLGFIIRHLTTTTMLSLLHPSSSGSVTISPKKGRTPKKGHPERRRDVTIQADPKYLDDPRDITAFKSAWDACQRITSPSSFEIFPRLIFSALKPFGTKNFWFESYCRCFLFPYYHFSGTCAMISKNDNKDNPNWVVDQHLKLRGHIGLYVCDASVFPAMVSNPPALTCAALGYEFARMILDEDGHKKS